MALFVILALHDSTRPFYLTNVCRIPGLIEQLGMVGLLENFPKSFAWYVVIGLLKFGGDFRPGSWHKLDMAPSFSQDQLLLENDPL